MKYLVLISCFLLSLTIDVNGRTDFIYVDLSSKSISINDTKKEVISLINKGYDNRFILFLSNGSDPYICESEEQLREVFRNVSRSGVRPDKPSQVEELNNINKVIANQNLIDGINQKNIQLNESIHFHFFYSKKNASIYNYVENITKKLLLTNRLYKKGSLTANCQVKVYFNCYHSKNCGNYLEKLQQKYPLYAYHRY